jgi:hypothetical protein
MRTMTMRIANSRKILAVAGALTLACGFGAGSALANGGDFFQEFADQMAQGDQTIGPSYFGFVRDSRGRTIRGAAVTATIMPSGSAMTVRTDILGHYRIPGFHKNIDPASVVISCTAPGYTQVSAARRGRVLDVTRPIETDCVLSTVTAEAS